MELLIPPQPIRKFDKSNGDFADYLQIFDRCAECGDIQQTLVNMSAE